MKRHRSHLWRDPNRGRMNIHLGRLPNIKDKSMNIWRVMIENQIMKEIMKVSRNKRQIGWENVYMWFFQKTNIERNWSTFSILGHSDRYIARKEWKKVVRFYSITHHYLDNPIRHDPCIIILLISQYIIYYNKPYDIEIILSITPMKRDERMKVWNINVIYQLPKMHPKCGRLECAML
jgi:hypothetical protein